MFVAFPAQMPPPFAQWIAMPTKSVCAFARAAGPDGAALETTATAHSSEPTPKTWVMSPKAPVPVFSSSMLAVDTPPKLHPARVNGTQGAGVVFWLSPTMLGSGSLVPVASSTRSVQYLKEVLNCGTPAAL